MPVTLPLTDAAVAQGGRAHLFRTEVGWRLALWLGLASTDEEVEIPTEVRLPKAALGGAAPPQAVRGINLVTGEEWFVSRRENENEWIFANVPLSDSAAVLVWDDGMMER